MTNTTAATAESEYIVRVSAAAMPSSCWGRYVHVAVLEVAPGTRPENVTIDERRRNVRRIVRVWRKCHSGKGVRDAASSAINAARELAATLNASGVW